MLFCLIADAVLIEKMMFC